MHVSMTAKTSMLLEVRLLSWTNSACGTFQSNRMMLGNGGQFAQRIRRVCHGRGRSNARSAHVELQGIGSI